MTKKVETIDDASSTSSGGSLMINGHKSTGGLGLRLTTSNLSEHKRSSGNSISPTTLVHGESDPLHLLHVPPRQVYYSATTLSPTLSPRVQNRLKTLKSALLIYFALLGLSPILKSLTKSTSSDSIWALATCLLVINLFLFDYGGLNVPTGSVESRSILSAPSYPSSLSTNAALMASTVLASRLTSTTHVFSLTLFSIEVFGLFPIFRRHLRQKDFTGYVVLTVALVIIASGGMGLILSTSYTHQYGRCGYCWSWIGHVLFRSMLGVLIGGFGTILTMGGSSWRLITLQRYKNVVLGPWDPAKPILAGHDGRRGTDGE